MSDRTIDNWMTAWTPGAIGPAGFGKAARGNSGGLIVLMEAENA